MPSAKMKKDINDKQISRDTAKLFSSKRISEIASGEFSYLLKIAAIHKEKLDDEFTSIDVLDIAYKAIAKEYRSEYFFKNTVAEKLLIGIHSTNTATALPEFRVGKNKADCVILNGSSTCYEIKTEFDNLDRLAEQLASYRKIFDRIFVVAGRPHIEKVAECSSTDIGIMELTKEKTLSTIRKAEFITDPIDVAILMRSLRVQEYTKIASHFYGKPIKHSNTEIFAFCEDILKKAPSEELRKIFCSTLKKTRAIEKDFIESLPKTLLMAGIGFKFNTNQRRSLIENLNRSFSKDSICTIQY